MAATRWEDVERWFRSARNNMEVLGPNEDRRAVIVNDLGLDQESTVAEVVRNMGGAFVDYGWYRLLGSGHRRMPMAIDAWNGVDSRLEPWRPGVVFVVAYDAVGGFFAMDSGALGFGRGRMVYLAPDSMRWEDLEMSYSGFLRWLADGDVAEFAEDHRWPGWEQEVYALSGSEGIFIAPPLWAEGPPIAQRNRTDVPMTELWTYAHRTMHRLEG